MWVPLSAANDGGGKEALCCACNRPVVPVSGTRFIGFSNHHVKPHKHLTDTIFSFLNMFSDLGSNDVAKNNLDWPGAST